MIRLLSAIFACFSGLFKLIPIIGGWLGSWEAKRTESKAYDRLAEKNKMVDDAVDGPRLPHAVPDGLPKRDAE